jgi:hypothetical protein
MEVIPLLMIFEIVFERVRYVNVHFPFFLLTIKPEHNIIDRDARVFVEITILLKLFN